MILVQSELEKQWLVANASKRDNDIFVRQHNIFVHKKNRRELGSLCYSDFILSESFPDSSVFDDNVDAFAPANIDGLLWLAQIQQLSKHKDYQNIQIRCRAYSSLYDVPIEHISRYADTFLDRIYEAWVANQIQSAMFYELLSRKANKSVLGSPRGALTLGLYRALAYFVSVRNNYCTVPVVKSQTNTAVYTIGGREDALNFSENKMRGNMLDVLKMQAQQIPSGSLCVDQNMMACTYNPYITCLTQNLDLATYKDLVRSGVFSIASTCTLYEHHVTRAPESIEAWHDWLSCLAKQALVKHIEIPDKSVCTEEHITYDTLVLDKLPARYEASFEHAVLYNKFFESSLLKYTAPTTSCFTIPGIPECLYDTLAGTDTWKLGSISKYSYFDSALFGFSFASTGGFEKAPVTLGFDVVTSTSVLSDYFSEMQLRLYGETYAFNILKVLAHRKLIEVTSTGVRLTRWGVSVYTALTYHVGTEDFLKRDAEHRNIMQAMLDATVPKHDTQISDHEVLANFLVSCHETYTDISRTMVNDSCYTVRTKNRKTGKRRTWKLVLERKKKIGVFKSGRHKRPVILEQKGRILVDSSSQFGGTNLMCHAHVLNVRPFKKSDSKIELVTPACPVCFCQTRRYVQDEQDLFFQCSCGDTQPAWFIPHTFANEPVKEISEPETSVEERRR